MRDFWVEAYDAYDNWFDTMITAPNVFSLFLFFEESYPGCRIIDYGED